MSEIDAKRLDEIEAQIAEMREQYGPELIAEFLRTAYDGIDEWWVHTPFVDESCSGLVMNVHEDVARFVADAYAALPDFVAEVRRLRKENARLRLPVVANQHLEAQREEARAAHLQALSDLSALQAEHASTVEALRELYRAAPMVASVGRLGWLTQHVGEYARALEAARAALPENKEDR